MRKQIAKTITYGILASFLAGCLFMLSIMFIENVQNPNYHENGQPRMNCFGGLQYGIAIAIQVLFL